MVQYRRYKGCNLRYVVMSSVAETSRRVQRAALFFIRLRYARLLHYATIVASVGFDVTTRLKINLILR